MRDILKKTIFCHAILQFLASFGNQAGRVLEWWVKGLWLKPLWIQVLWLIYPYINIAFYDFLKLFFSYFNAKLIKYIILSRNVFFLSFLVELGIFYVHMGLRKNYYRKSLRSSLHTHLRQHGKQKLSPGPWPPPPVNFLMESINHRLYNSARVIDDWLHYNDTSASCGCVVNYNFPTFFVEVPRQT